jgi:CHAT domain-containing protein
LIRIRGPAPAALASLSLLSLLLACPPVRADADRSRQIESALEAGTRFARVEAFAKAAPHYEEAARLAEGLSEEEQRWFLEFQCKSFLLWTLIELGQSERARSLSQVLHQLSGAHGVDAAGTVSLLTNAQAQALSHNQTVKAEDYQQAIGALATGEARDIVQMSGLAEESVARLFLGEYAVALSSARKAHQMLESNPDAKRSPLALSVLRTRGTVYLYLNEPGEALKVFEEGDGYADGILREAAQDPQALKVAEFQAAAFYAKMATAQILAGRSSGEAARTIDKAYAAAKGFEGLAGYLGLDRLKAQVGCGASEPHQDECLRRAKDIMRQADDATGAAVLSLSGVLSDAEFSSLLKDFPGLLALASREDRIQLYGGLARGFEARDDGPSAIRNYVAAIDLIEEGRIQARGTPALPAFFSSYVELYDRAVAALYEASARTPGAGSPDLQRFGRTYAEAALYFAEAAHARAFAELYGPALLESFGARADLPAGLREQERRLRARMAQAVDPALGTSALFANPLAARALSDEAVRVYREFIDKTLAPYPEWASLAFPRPVALEQLPASLRQSFIILYKVTDRAVFWWLVRDRTIVGFERIPMDRRALQDNVEAFIKEIDDPAKAAPLAALVSGPFARIEKMAAAGKAPARVIVVPDGILYKVPWEALPELHGGYLGESFVISYAPSLTVLAQSLRARTAFTPKTALLIGDVLDKTVDIPVRGVPASFAPLGKEPFTKIVSTVKTGAYRTTVLERFQATPDALLHRDMRGYALLHFDTHAFAESLDPLPSLILHPSANYPLGLLTLTDIATLRLKARLVTLSACQTGLGKNNVPLEGEGVEGLARMFMIAGSKSVLASLWEVRSDATGALMIRFYRELFAGGGSDAALALFRAKKALLKTGYRLPSLWAPFILIGDS